MNKRVIEQTTYMESGFSPPQLLYSSDFCFFPNQESDLSAYMLEEIAQDLALHSRRFDPALNAFTSDYIEVKRGGFLDRRYILEDFSTREVEKILSFYNSNETQERSN